MCIYKHTHIHTYIRTYILTHIYTYVRAYIHTYIHTYIYIYTYTLIQYHNVCIYICMYVHIHTMYEKETCASKTACRCSPLSTRILARLSGFRAFRVQGFEALGFRVQDEDFLCIQTNNNTCRYVQICIFCRMGRPYFVLFTS